MGSYLSCGMWDLVPRPGIELGPPALEHEVLATGSPGRSRVFHMLIDLCLRMRQWEKGVKPSETLNASIFP